MVGKHGWIGLVFVALLLAGCGRTATALVGTPTPTAALSCSASTASGSRSGDLIVSVGYAFFIPSRELPATIPLKPLQVPKPGDTAALDAQIPPLPIVNPHLDSSIFPGYTIYICNASTTASHLIEGAVLQIASFTPFVGGVNEMDTCGYGFFTRSVPSGLTGGGCGGSQVIDEELQVTFPPQAGAGFAAAAVQTGVDGSLNRFGPLPVTLAPGKGVSLLMSVTTIPQAPGTYTQGISCCSRSPRLGGMNKTDGRHTAPEGSLRAALQTLPDVRRGQGKVHRLDGMLALSVCALLWGCRSVYAISQWGRECEPEIRVALGLRAERGPSVATRHRAFRRLDHAAFERGLGQWFAAQGRPPDEAVAIDGKTLRGIHGEQIPGVHLVAASAHQTRVVLAEAETVGKGHELAGVQAVLAVLPARLLAGRVVTGRVVTGRVVTGRVVTGRVVTGDALLATRALCRQIRRKGGTLSSS